MSECVCYSVGKRRKIPYLSLSKLCRKQEEIRKSSNPSENIHLICLYDRMDYVFGSL